MIVFIEDMITILIACGYGFVMISGKSFDSQLLRGTILSVQPLSIFGDALLKSELDKIQKTQHEWKQNEMKKKTWDVMHYKL